MYAKINVFATLKVIYEGMMNEVVVCCSYCVESAGNINLQKLVYLHFYKKYYFQIEFFDTSLPKFHLEFNFKPRNNFYFFGKVLNFIYLKHMLVVFIKSPSIKTFLYTEFFTKKFVRKSRVNLQTSWNTS